MIRTGDFSHPLLRRPISIHSARDGIVEIYFQRAGIGTALLGQTERGDLLDVSGPLGKGFHLELPAGKKRAACVGGGRGIAPLYFLAQKLRAGGVDPLIFYGGKTRADIPLEKKFAAEGFETRISTDDGSAGFEGFVTDLLAAALREYAPDRVFACGPEAMMEEVARIARERNLDAEFSLESYMGCGFGACWGCVRKIKNGTDEEWVKVCEEGPVFTAGRIVWQEEA